MLKRTALAAAAALLLTCPARAADPPSLDGQWQGVIKFEKDAFLADSSTPAAGTVMRIVIDGKDAHVFVLQPPGVFDEERPGLFRVARSQSNALIFTIVHALPDSGTWVEYVTGLPLTVVVSSLMACVAMVAGSAEPVPACADIAVTPKAAATAACRMRFLC